MKQWGHTGSHGQPGPGGLEGGPGGIGEVGVGGWVGGGDLQRCFTSLVISGKQHHSDECERSMENSQRGAYGW
ncbi:hypothetical protein EYF80_022668 [Liparis tanakae]|uniref:Uncharacterized protein n=1 Tax=Liparis tanakae TaxID=230148 RepID=A0A4Z2HMR4_9TELE|nr:hypothetical protein EYF80_022668 [Liparis tanakae]